MIGGSSFCHGVAGPGTCAERAPVRARHDLAEAAVANKWALGLINGIWVDKNNHLWLFHSPEQLPAYITGAAQSPPAARDVVYPRRQFSSSTHREMWCAVTAARAGYEWPSSGHGISRRLPGQRLDRHCPDAQGADDCEAGRHDFEIQPRREIPCCRSNTADRQRAVWIRRSWAVPRRSG